MEVFVLTFCNNWNSFGTLLFFRSSSTALQKDSFRIVKGMLLQGKRPRFTSQKTAFCNALNIKLLHNTTKTGKKLHYIRQTADEKLGKC